jgi:hypothetical protein
MFKKETMERNRNFSKEPWLAVVLSLCLPGIGQIYAGRINMELMNHIKYRRIAFLFLVTTVEIAGTAESLEPSLWTI